MKLAFVLAYFSSSVETKKKLFEQVDVYFTYTVVYLQVTYNLIPEQIFFYETYNVKLKLDELVDSDAYYSDCKNGKNQHHFHQYLEFYPLRNDFPHKKF